MKKLFVTSVIFTSVMSGFAFANGDVTFFGSVTATTCSLVPEVEGTVNKVIQLGQAKPSAMGAEIPFALVKDPSDVACDATLGANNVSADISWDSPQMGPTGLGLVSGGAVGTFVEIKTVNATGSQVTISSTSKKATFAGATVLADGAKFTAKMIAGTQPGDFRTAAAYAITYK